VLEDTVERIYSGSTFAEKWCGLFLIRGENVVLLGEIVSGRPPVCCRGARMRVPPRTWTKKTMYRYSRLTSICSTSTIDKKPRRRNTATNSRPRCSSTRRAFAEKVAKAMVIDPGAWMCWIAPRHVGRVVVETPPTSSSAQQAFGLFFLIFARGEPSSCSWHPAESSCTGLVRRRHCSRPTSYIQHLLITAFVLVRLASSMCKTLFPFIL
jgi:hypothetical protein